MGASLEEWKGPGWLDCALRNSVALSGSRVTYRPEVGMKAAGRGRETQGSADFQGCHQPSWGG